MSGYDRLFRKIYSWNKNRDWEKNIENYILLKDDIIMRRFVFEWLKRGDVLDKVVLDLATIRDDTYSFVKKNPIFLEFREKIKKISDRLDITRDLNKKDSDLTKAIDLFNRNSVRYIKND